VSTLVGVFIAILLTLLVHRTVQIVIIFTIIFLGWTNCQNCILNCHNVSTNSTTEICIPAIRLFLSPVQPAQLIILFRLSVVPCC